MGWIWIPNPGGVVRNVVIQSGRIVFVWACHHLKHQGHIFNGSRHPADMIKRPTQGHDAESTHPPESWFQTHNAVIRRRPKDRTPCLSPECGRTHHSGNRGGRATARTARRMVGVPRITGWGWIAIGKLGSNCLAQHDSARLLKTRHSRCIVFRNKIRINLGTSRSRHTSGVENILNPGRDTD